jgi:hypothetical protein
VIPTMLLVGLALGRRWAIVAGGVGWGAALLVTGTIGVADVPVAVVLAAANVTVGVWARRVLAWALGIRRRLPGAA